jgi:heterotetrameric sarcosine oxidase gamma subunit
VSLEFLAPGDATADRGFEPVARSAMEREARTAGARFETRDGWNVAVGYGSSEQERERCASAVGWCDASHLGKLELQGSREDLASIVGACAGGATLQPGCASRAADAWWCPVSPTRAIVVCEPAALPDLRHALEQAADAAAGPTGVVEVTSAWAALRIVGPLAREAFARFTALDLRPRSMPVRGFRPGSVGRTPGLVLREAEDRFLMLFGWAFGQYMWTVVADAAGSLGGGPVGVDVLPPIDERSEQVEEAGRA